MRQSPYYVAGWFLPLVAVTAIVLLATALGIANPDFTLQRALGEFATEGTTLPSLPKGILVALPFQLMFTALVATPILWGEEFGWRGTSSLLLFH